MRMASASRGADPLRPQRPAGLGRGAALALVVHGGLLLALALGVSWRASEPTGATAELWAAVPEFAAPAAAAPPPEPAPRAVLATRIEQRVHRMIAMGLVGEVRSLLERAEGFGRTARQALGYKELIEHLEGRITIDAAVAAIVQRTRQFAVRQERWFRRDPRIRRARSRKDRR